MVLLTYESRIKISSSYKNTNAVKVGSDAYVDPFTLFCKPLIHNIQLTSMSLTFEHISQIRNPRPQAPPHHDIVILRRVGPLRGVAPAEVHVDAGGGAGQGSGDVLDVGRSLGVAFAGERHSPERTVATLFRSE